MKERVLIGAIDIEQYDSFGDINLQKKLQGPSKICVKKNRVEVFSRGDECCT